MLRITAWSNPVSTMGLIPMPTAAFMAGCGGGSLPSRPRPPAAVMSSLPDSLRQHRNPRTFLPYRPPGTPRQILKPTWTPARWRLPTLSSVPRRRRTWLNAAQGTMLKSPRGARQLRQCGKVWKSAGRSMCRKSCGSTKTPFSLRTKGNWNTSSRKTPVPRLIWRESSRSSTHSQVRREVTNWMKNASTMFYWNTHRIPASEGMSDHGMFKQEVKRRRSGTAPAAEPGRVRPWIGTNRRFVRLPTGPLEMRPT